VERPLSILVDCYIPIASTAATPGSVIQRQGGLTIESRLVLLTQVNVKSGYLLWLGDIVMGTDSTDKALSVSKLTAIQQQLEINPQRMRRLS
jgi:hypothetical protein